MCGVLPTRSELLERRRRTVLAEQGRDLLSDKGAALTGAFAERSALLPDRLTEIEQRAAAARGRLAGAYASVGRRELRSAALADRASIDVEASASVIAGVAVVDLGDDEVQRRPHERGPGAATTGPAIDDVADASEEAVDDLLDLAALAAARTAAASRTTRCAESRPSCGDAPTGPRP